MTKKDREFRNLPFLQSERSGSLAAAKSRKSFELLRDYMSAERERRSTRLTICMTPSLASIVKDIAEQTGDSVNNLINMILEEHIEEYRP